jgi:hypothetical protein
MVVGYSGMQTVNTAVRIICLEFDPAEDTARLSKQGGTTSSAALVLEMRAAIFTITKEYHHYVKQSL